MVPKIIINSESYTCSKLTIMVYLVSYSIAEYYIKQNREMPSTTINGEDVHIDKLKML